MSADRITPLFKLNDEDNITYEDDPTVIQVRANLVAAEQVQQEKVKQRRLKREQWWAEVEVERLRGEIEEAERKQRGLKEAELRRLEEEKGRLEREKQVKEQCGAELHGAERVTEQRRAAFVALLPSEAGPNKAPPRQPK